jgi:hypothetical protein
MTGHVYATPARQGGHDTFTSSPKDFGLLALCGRRLPPVAVPGPETQRPSELATPTHMIKQALNYLLEQLGYLTRETDGNDQRSKRVRLTPTGRAATKAIYEIVQEVEDDWEQQLGPRKFGQLRSLLTKLNAIAAHTRDQGAARNWNESREQGALGNTLDGPGSREEGGSRTAM